MGFELGKKQIIFLLLAITVILAALPWMQEGIAGTDDFRGYVAFIWHIQHSFEEKGYVSFWMQELYSGWPTFHFYSIMPFILSLPLILLFGTVTALKYSVILSFILAAVSMFYASKMLFEDDDVSLVSSVAYTFFTYHFMNADSRGALLELFGYALFPIAIAFMIKAIDKPDRKKISLAIIFSASMILTHVATAYMLFLVFFLYLAYKIISEKKIEMNSIKRTIAILAGALLISAFIMIPFYSEMKKASFPKETPDGGLKVFGQSVLDSKEGISLGQAFARKDGLRGADGKGNFYIGFSLIALFFVSFLYKNKLARFFSYLAIFFLLTQFLPIILNLLPFVSVMNWSFRFFLVIGFSMALLAGTSAKALVGNLGKSATARLVLLIIISAIIIIDFYPANKPYWVSQPDHYFINDPAQVQVLEEISKEPGYFMVFTPTAQMAYAYHGKFEMGYDWEGYRQGVIGEIQNNYTTDAFAFIDGLKTGDLNKTIAVSRRLGYYGVKYIVLPCINGLEQAYPVKYTNKAFCAYENPAYTPLIMASNGTVKNELFDMNTISFDATLDSDSSVLLKVSHFEGHWHAYVDGIETKIYDAFPKYMQINVAQGNHNIEFRYENTGLQIITKIISILTLIILMGYFFELDKKILSKGSIRSRPAKESAKKTEDKKKKTSRVR